MKTSKLPPLFLIALLSIVLIALLLFWNSTNHQSKQHQQLNLIATPTGGDFTVETKNNSLSLNDLRGKVVILYFGYTTCPDICPTSLALLTQALNKMTPDALSGVQSIFISVDPDRDNVTRLDQYTKYFHDNIIGATAKKESIDKLVKQYGAAYQKVDSKSAVGYLVDHSSYTYIIDKKGTLRESLAHGSSSEKILAVVKTLLAE